MKMHNYLQQGFLCAASVDYVLVSASLAFPGGSSGSLSRSLNVLIIDDPIDENMKFFTLTLSQFGSNTSNIASAVVTIIDDDCEC